MKLTEPKILSWDHSEKFNYVYGSKGKKLMKIRNNNPFDKSKNHLGLYETQANINADSPTYKERPQGK